MGAEEFTIEEAGGFHSDALERAQMMINQGGIGVHNDMEALYQEPERSKQVADELLDQEKQVDQCKPGNPIRLLLQKLQSLFKR